MTHRLRHKVKPLPDIQLVFYNLLTQRVCVLFVQQGSVHGAELRINRGTCSSSTTPRQINLRAALHCLKLVKAHVIKLNVICRADGAGLHLSEKRKLSCWKLYLHKNSEQQNSDANLQSQFSHVFPAVWGRHIHDSEIIRQVKRTKAVPVSPDGSSLCIPPQQSERFQKRCFLITHAVRLHPDSVT